MLLENNLILSSLKSFYSRSVADTNDVVSRKKFEELKMTRLIFDGNEDCYTSGKSIVIGKQFSGFTEDVNDNVRYKRVQGVIIHELAHQLFTSFKDFSSFVNTAPQKYKSSKVLAKNILNILEDYRIEQRISEMNPYYKKLFLMIRYPIVRNIFDIISNKTINDDKDRVAVIANSLLFMGFMGHPFRTNDKKTDIIIMSILPLIKRSVRAKTTKEVCDNADKIMKILSRLDCEQDEALKDSSIGFPSRVRSSGSTSPVESDDITETSKPLREILGELSDSGSIDADAEDVDQVQDIGSNLEEASEQAKKMLNKLKSEYSSEVSRIERSDITERIIDSYFNGDDNAAEKRKENEKKKIIDIKKELPAMHRGQQLVFREGVSIQKYTVQRYNELKNVLRPSINKTVNKLNNLVQIKIEDWEYEQKSGSLDTDSLTRFLAFDDLDIFKKQYPEEVTLGMDIMLLVDCSGSNSSTVLNKQNGERIPRYKLNQMIAIFLHEIFKEMEWKHSIWGFDSNSSNEFVAPLLPFTECFSKFSGLSLRDINARNANRDGYHIRLAGKHLAGNAETNKRLLIVLSDGQPAANNYGGASAMRDVFEATKELKEIDVKTIGIFSGDPSENKYFKDMYENHIFLNNESLHNFKEVLSGLITKEFEEEE